MEKRWLAITRNFHRSNWDFRFTLNAKTKNENWVFCEFVHHFFPFPFGWFLIWKILKRNEFSSEKKSIWNYESKSKIPCSLPLRIHFDENEIKIGNRVHSRKAIRKKWTEKYEKNWRDNETKVIAKRRTFLVHFSANENRKKSIKNIILLDHFSWEVSNCLFSNVHIFISFLFILFRLSFDFMLFSFFIISLSVIVIDHSGRNIDDVYVVFFSFFRFIFMKQIAKVYSEALKEAWKE